MREFDEPTITGAVLERLANTDPRARRVSHALVKHLGAFIRKIEPTEAEWEWGIRSLTETGQLCSDTYLKTRINHKPPRPERSVQVLERANESESPYERGRHQGPLFRTSNAASLLQRLRPESPFLWWRHRFLVSRRIEASEPRRRTSHIKANGGPKWR